MVCSSRHGDDALASEGLDLLGQQLVLLVTVAQHAAASKAPAPDGSVGGEGEVVVCSSRHGDEQNQLLPKKIEALAGQRAVAVSVGGAHCLAITVDGAVWSWGSGAFGMLGHGNQQDQLPPKKVGALAGRRVVAVSAGRRHSLARAADGAVFTWGEGETGCLGHGEDQSNQLLPKSVEAWA